MTMTEILITSTLFFILMVIIYEFGKLSILSFF